MLCWLHPVDTIYCVHFLFKTKVFRIVGKTFNVHLYPSQTKRRTERFRGIYRRTHQAVKRTYRTQDNAGSPSPPHHFPVRQRQGACRGVWRGARRGGGTAKRGSGLNAPRHKRFPLKEDIGQTPWGESPRPPLRGAGASPVTILTGVTSPRPGDPSQSVSETD